MHSLINTSRRLKRTFLFRRFLLKNIKREDFPLMVANRYNKGRKKVNKKVI